MVSFFLENAGELHLIILRRRWDKNPVTTHTTNATFKLQTRWLKKGHRTTRLKKHQSTPGHGGSQEGDSSSTCHRPKSTLFSFHDQGLTNSRSHTIKNTTVPVVPYDPSAQYYQRVEPTLDHTTSCFIDSLPPNVKELIRGLRSKRVKPNLSKKYISKLSSEDTGSEEVIDIFFFLVT